MRVKFKTLQIGRACCGCKLELPAGDVAAFLSPRQSMHPACMLEYLRDRRKRMYARYTDAIDSMRGQKRGLLAGYLHGSPVYVSDTRPAERLA